MQRVAIVVLAAALALPAAARADGLSAAPVQGGSGVGMPGHAARYVALGVPGGTLVERLVRGRVDSWRVLPGHFGVPSVAGYDGSTTGLSADMRTLVLAALPRRYPPRRTRLAVLQLHRFVVRVRQRVDLRGFFAVDAVSPDGRRVYLIHYTHPKDVLRYEVRAYDLPSRRLLAKPIVDPREPDEKMQGTPVTRVVSADGRWAYTLYARPQGAPFIHALDTRAGTAACIDLDGVRGTDANLHLIAPRRGGPLVVADRSGPVKLVDRRTFAVSEPVRATPSPAPPAAKRAAPPAASDGGSGWIWGAAGIALAALALLTLAARRRRRVAAKTSVD